ncbi:pyridoxamine 5'-phosphate oxidase family protein [Phenylobacterium sp.]|jgi:general stress protein 26|uniref:pyridoxamine 5'-phosphate oxidase family protein n=1 Tax=Phenylobacterium sp. TaxID=1871053 RepID=UPI002F3FA6A4
MSKVWIDLDATQRQLWDAIERRRAGMLSLTKSGLHAQPMLASVERRRKRLWFIASRENDLVREVGEGASCAFVFQDDEMMASISGALHLVDDRRRMSRLWNPMTAAWLPEGLHDPKLTLVRMDCVDAEVWVAGVGLTKIAWEIAWTAGAPQVMDVGGGRHATLH